MGRRCSCLLCRCPLHVAELRDALAVLDSLSVLSAGVCAMKVLLFANTDWYLFNFRRSLAQALRDAGCELLLVSPEGKYGHRLRELGFEWVPAPMLRRSL